MRDENKPKKYVSIQYFGNNDLKDLPKCSEILMKCYEIQDKIT